VSGFSENMSGKTFAQINAADGNKTNNHPTVDPEMLWAFIGGYMDKMREAVPKDSNFWSGYLRGLQALEGSVLGWLERNAK